MQDSSKADIGCLTASTDAAGPLVACRRFFEQAFMGDSTPLHRPRIDRRRGAGPPAPLLLSILAPFCFLFASFLPFAAFDDDKFLSLACRAGEFRNISTPIPCYFACAEKKRTTTPPPGFLAITETIKAPIRISRRAPVAQSLTFERRRQKPKGQRI